MTSGKRSLLSAWPTITTRLRGSCASLLATSSRQALSTLLRRARLRGDPPDVQVTASGFGFSGHFTRTLSLADAVPPRPSETCTVTVMVVPQGTPAVSSVASAPVPVTRPALADQV